MLCVVYKQIIDCFVIGIVGLRHQHSFCVKHSRVHAGNLSNRHTENSIPLVTQLLHTDLLQNITKPLCRLICLLHTHSTSSVFCHCVYATTTCLQITMIYISIVFSLTICYRHLPTDYYDFPSTYRPSHYRYTCNVIMIRRHRCKGPRCP